MFRDRRFWKPDKTCIPFFLNTNINNVDLETFPALRFKVPDNNDAVITHYRVQYSSHSDKDENSLVICTDEYHQAAALNENIGVSLTGIMKNVVETSQVVGNYPGLSLVNINEAIIPCRILLRPNTYFVGVRRTFGFMQTIVLKLFGYTYPCQT